MTGRLINHSQRENIGNKNISIIEEVDVNSGVGVDDSHSRIQGVEK